MDNEQFMQIPKAGREKGSLLSQAGQLSLERQKINPTYTNHESKPYGRSKILQQVNNDDEFKPLTNITTTYIQIVNPPSSSRGQKEKQSQIRSSRKQQPKQILKVDQSQYQKLTRRIKHTSEESLKGLSHKRATHKSNFVENESDLGGIQSILQDIQRTMQLCLSSETVSSPFKKSASSSKHYGRKFPSKGIYKFGDSRQLNRLDEMLLNYNIDDGTIPQKSEKQIVQVSLNDRQSKRKGKNQERMNRLKKYNQISKSLAETEPKVEPKSKIIQIKQQNTIQPLVKQKVEKDRINNENILTLNNIEIIEIDWFKLPLFLSQINYQNSQLILTMKDYPDDESFWQAISESLGQEKKYSAYSIFNGSIQAGVKKSKTLMSQQQFRQVWAEEWDYQIEQQEHKDLLCQLDFQWYRSLIQATYSHSLEDLLIKNITYDTGEYVKNLRIINGGPSNDKNKGKEVPLSQIVAFNKLRYIQALLNKHSTLKEMKTNKRQLFIAVVPNIGQFQSKQVFQSMKGNLKQIFVGGLYSSDNSSNGSSMGVMITKRQASSGKVAKWQGGKIQLGNVQLLINENDKGTGDRIILSRVKSKNSSIKIMIVTKNKEQIVLEVGEELYLGRRYHIFID